MVLEQLYGVTPTFTTAQGQEIGVTPSIDLISSLSCLPRGTKVGLGCLDPDQATRLLAGKEEFMSTLRGFPYWLGLLKSGCLGEADIVFLDNPNLLKLSLGSDTRQLQLLGDLDSYCIKERLKVSTLNQGRVVPQVSELMKKIYAEAQRQVQVMVFNRGENFTDQIKNHAVDVAVLPKGHAEYLASDQARGEHGLTVMEYNREGLDLIPVGPYEEICPKFQPDVKPSPNTLLIRELKRRGIRAVNEGRITTGLEPELMGTWAASCPPAGLFEMYLEEQVGIGLVRGIVEDVNGTADFEGELSDSRVDLEWRYRPGESIAFEEPLRLKGFGVARRYQGKLIKPDGDVSKFLLNLGSTFTE